MGQDTDSNKNLDEDIDLDEDWDDLDLDADDFEDDLDEFEEDKPLEAQSPAQNTSTGSSDTDDDLDSEFSDDMPSDQKDKKPAKVKKKSGGGGLIMGIMALATLGSVSWLALGSNSNLLSGVTSLLGDNTQPQQPTISLNTPETAVAEPETIPAESGLPTFDTPQDSAQGNVVSDDIIPMDSSVDAANPFELQTQQADNAEDGGVLTPMPNLDTLKEEPDSILADLNLQDDAAAPAQPETVAQPVQQEEPPISLEDPAAITQDSPIPALDDPQGIPEIGSQIPALDEPTPAPEAPIENLDAQLAIPEETIPQELTPLDNASQGLAEDKMMLETDKKYDDVQLPASENEIAVVDALPTPQEPVVEEIPVIEDVVAIEPEPKAEIAALDIDTAPPAPEAVASVVEPVKAPEVKEPVKKVEKPVRMPQWEMRSASSSSALIYDKLSGEMQSIGVGSNVKGVGRVKSIEKINGKWVIVGTQGKISQ